MLLRLRDYALITVGCVLQALAMDLFLIPAQLAAGGVSGLAQIVNAFTGWPIGVMVTLLNLPLFVLGWRYLGGRRFMARTVFTVGVYSALVDVLALYLPRTGLTGDPFLNALYGGVLGGVGMGLVFRAQGTTGGTDIIARILGRWRGVPLSQSYLITDTAIVFSAGLAFGWEQALYAVVALYISGLAAEASAEGVGIVRAATIITARPQAIADRVLQDMARGVTGWAGTGMYSGQARHVLFVAVSRAEVSQLKAIIHEADPAAFVVIGQAHEALGEGFKPIKE
ncbi:MAG: YitT family protein [Anaerolineales bacterium]|nr:YitT family protein [Anaerolineales bacterium]